MGDRVVGNYRLKNCKRCGKEHRKQGPYCSLSCGNVRVHSEQDKLIRSIKLKEYHDTPEGIATRRKLSNHHKKRAETNHARANGEYILQPDDYAVQIPDFEDDDKIIW